MSKPDYYEVLEVTREVTTVELKKAYRKKAIEFHPDRNPGDTAAEENFKLAAEAYEVLSDPDKRARYDRYGHAAFEGGGFGQGGMNMEDIFSQFGDIFGSAFGGGFSGFSGFGGGQRRVKGSNLRIRVTLNLEEVAQGVEKKVKVRRKVQAPGVTYTTCTTSNEYSFILILLKNFFVIHSLILQYGIDF
jgi:molecular chaperone DnaJ